MDKAGKIYNIEVQRADDGAGEKRARYYSAVLDTNLLLPRQKFSELPETYVIFITEHDVLKGGLPLYHIDRQIRETGLDFCDESHIIYVNGEYRGNDDVGRLMHDFSCSDPDAMNSRLLAERTRYFKKDEKGVRRMCKIMEDFAAEERRENSIETAEEMLKEGSLSFELISRFTKLSIEQVKELAEQVKAAAM